MNTRRNLLLAAVLALSSLAPAMEADATRALSGRPLAVSLRDFGKALSPDNSSDASATLPRMVSSLLSPLWVKATSR